MNIDEKRIREFAYLIWQSEGEPEGQEERHWDMACKLAEAESSSGPAHTEDSFGDMAVEQPSDNHLAESEEGVNGGGANGPNSLDSASPHKL